MPSLNELLKNAGVEIPSSVNLATLIEESDEVKGLVTTKTELQQWKTENKPLLDTLQAESEANQKAAQEAIEEKKTLALKNNDLQAYLDAEKEGREKAELALSSTREGVKNATHDKVVTELAALFNDGLVGKSFATQLAETTINESGEVATIYKIGENSYSDFEAFKSELAKDKGYGSHMKAADSKGPQFSGHEPKATDPNKGQSAADILYS